MASIGILRLDSRCNYHPALHTFGVIPTWPGVFCLLAKSMAYSFPIYLMSYHPALRR